MKRINLLLFLSIFTIGSIFAQSRCIYVSLHGGKKIPGGFKYNSVKYQFDPQCDTLICNGPGYSGWYVPDNSVSFNGIKGIPQKNINYLIRKSVKKVAKRKMSTGEFKLKFKGQNYKVRYKNAERSGEADFHFESI
ncbi:MAG: hypothetical protein H6605_01590 [Flavobacteriales bacterium]|nr:hypothetical protein [Flavobacteriales bacterium]